MIDRILEIMKEKKLSPSQFADEIGIQRSGISHLISGRNKPSLEFIMKVLKRFPEIKPEWLLQGNSQDSVANDDSAGHLNLMSQPSLFEETESPDHTDSKKNVRGPKKEKGEKRIEKILIFYTDRTFREYDPEN